MKKVAWKKISRFEVPEQSPGFLLWQVSTHWRRLIETALAKIGLTHPQFVILANLGWLHRNQSVVTQVELARHCRTDITMTSQILRTLEKKGLIERRLREGNEKSKFPQTTDKGSRLVEQAIAIVEQIDRSFFETLGSDIEFCVAILQKLTRNPDSHRGKLSKLAILEKSGLIGCLTGTDITSKNYKKIYHEIIPDSI